MAPFSFAFVNSLNRLIFLFQAHFSIKALSKAFELIHLRSTTLAYIFILFELYDHIQIYCEILILLK